MWKKDEAVPVQPTAATMTSSEAPRAPVARPTGQAMIGPSIVIKGEVTGNEDLLIHGQLDGSVKLGSHSVTVGDGGRVKADITGRIITIEGNVEGNLDAKDQIILRGTATVQGDIKAPRVVLEDGARFRGLVDMGVRGDESRAVNGTTSKSDSSSEKSQPATAARPQAPKGKEATQSAVGA